MADQLIPPLDSRFREGTHWDVDPETGCWNWKLYKDARGYGSSTDGAAHRAVWVQSGRELGPEHDLHHRCLNTSCVNPDHLEPLSRVVHLTMHGQERSALEWNDVREIRRLHQEDGVTIFDLAERFGLGKSQVHRIVINEDWHDPEFEPGLLRECRECGEPFRGTRTNQQFCCPLHTRRWNSRLTSRRGRERKRAA